MKELNKDLYIFDVDWTLRETISGKTFPERPNDWRWMSGRLEILQELWTAEKKIVLATNRAGSFWRAVTGQEKYPTATDDAQALRFFLLDVPGTLSHRPQTPPLLLISLYDERAATLCTDSQLVLRGIQDQMFGVFDGLNVLISYESKWRKPQPGMLDYAIRYYKQTPQTTIFVGDLDDDKQAADAAGCSFMWAHEFFVDGHKEA